MPFNIGDTVKKKDGTKNGGTIEHMGCAQTTTAGGKTCSKKTCPHNPKDFLFVRWPDGTLTSGQDVDYDLENAATSTTGVDPNSLINEDAIKAAEADKVKRAKEMEDKLKAFESDKAKTKDIFKNDAEAFKKYYGLMPEAIANLPKLGGS